MAAYTASAGIIVTILLVALLVLTAYRPTQVPVGESYYLLDRAVAYHLTVNALEASSDPRGFVDALNEQLSYISPLYHRFSGYDVKYYDRRLGYVGAVVEWRMGYGPAFLTSPFLSAEELAHHYYYDAKVASWILKSKVTLLTERGYPPRATFRTPYPCSVERSGSIWTVRVLVPASGTAVNATIYDWRGLSVILTLGGS